ncbi:hypothetical protein DPMN_071369 [Dreissena polymorpha]|uniref:Uncharacterized protein n=1 Tax=Dreissena polymorpha TaxID=45954 RepID=A0A9D3Z4H6_DREPO|nr:hypothetical protein DPMN_071369 [Dreissena polymorpha]
MAVIVELICHVVADCWGGYGGGGDGGGDGISGGDGDIGGDGGDCDGGDCNFDGD